jgi:hypothetical protein
MAKIKNYSNYIYKQACELVMTSDNNSTIVYAHFYCANYKQPPMFLLYIINYL